MSAAPQLYEIKDLTIPQKDLIKASIPILESSGVDLTKAFYNYMLETYAEVKPFFNETNQKNFRQPKVLAFALLNYAKNIDDLAPLTAFVQQIVTKHVGLQIKAEHYPIVGNSLISTMGKLLGPEIATPEFVTAWSTAYGNLAQILINAEWEQYQKQPWNGFKEFTVTKIEEEAKDIKSVYFTPSDGSKISLPLHGQYLGFRFTIPGDDIEKSREYSISQYPNSNEYRISVKKLDEGKVSTYINEQLKAGDKFKVAPPNGTFTYQDFTNDVLLFAGGIGITPIIPILEKALASNRKVTLFYSNKSQEQRPFGEYFKELQGKYNNFTFNEFFSNENNRLSAKDFEFSHKDFDVYMLGPIGYMDFVREELKKHDITEIRSEFFGPTNV
ncbi:flavohemoglobin [Saccharomycopsis crataegensis]|uniref:nitric oxide dioxygenase n=1 Tax=Saccharomycopsis crataegensis TaxID=43959 RepID=A0AAV5QDI2_9ASCO|nr:flavohemoglobin [Saccharomycopsis crataegensis]